MLVGLLLRLAKMQSRVTRSSLVEAGSLEVHAWLNGTELTTAWARVDPVYYAGLAESQQHYTPYTFQLSNGNWYLTVTYQDQPPYTELITINNNALRRDVHFAATAKGYLTVYGKLNGQEVPVSFTIDGVLGGPWTTNKQFLLDAGDYTVRAHWLQQDKVFQATVYANQNTDLILQFNQSDYGFITVETKVGTTNVVAHITISDATGKTIYDFNTTDIAGSTVNVLPGTYTINAEYAGASQTKTATVTCPATGCTPTSGVLVVFDFTPPTPKTVTVNVRSVVGAEATQAEKDAFALLGDINRDCAIDWSDAKPLIAAYGSGLGGANWNPACDLNKDGVIDGKDFGIYAKNYGKTILTGEESHVSCQVRKSTGELVKEFTTPDSVVLDVGEYVAYAGGQTKEFIIREEDADQTRDLIFYLLSTAEFPWWILGLIAAGFVLAVVVSEA
jgi:hypothetical protein